MGYFWFSVISFKSDECYDEMRCKSTWTLDRRVQTEMIKNLMAKEGLAI